MNNDNYKTISKICQENDIYLVDSEIRIIAARLNLLTSIQNKEQTGGSIKNQKIINDQLERCISPVFILKNAQNETVKNILYNILKGNLIGASLICGKYTK